MIRSTPGNVKSNHIISYHYHIIIISVHFISFHCIRHQNISYHCTSYDFKSFHIISCHDHVKLFITFHTLMNYKKHISHIIGSYGIISNHITSHHIISHHIISSHHIILSQNQAISNQNHSESHQLYQTRAI
jgi:hypothetical protein